MAHANEVRRTLNDRFSLIAWVTNPSHDRFQIRDGRRIVIDELRVGGGATSTEQLYVYNAVGISSQASPSAVGVKPGLAWDKLSDNGEDRRCRRISWCVNCRSFSSVVRRG